MARNKEVRIGTIIGKEAECNGAFSSGGSVRVDGSITGNVNVSGTLIVGAAGVIRGDITAQSVIVGGQIEGNLQISERTELTSSARLVGDIYTKILVIDENAVFQGRCEMNNDGGRPGARDMREMKRESRAAIVEAMREMEGGSFTDSEE